MFILRGKSSSGISPEKLAYAEPAVIKVKLYICPLRTIYNTVPSLRVKYIITKVRMELWICVHVLVFACEGQLHNSVQKGAVTVKATAAKTEVRTRKTTG